MTRTQTILTGAAAVQLALTAVMWWPRTERAAEPTDLVALPGALDRIAIHGRRQAGEPDPGVKVELKKVDGNWVVANAHDYPADATKVQELVDHLEHVMVRAPVTRQPASHASLNVADADHARTVDLGSGEHTVSLVLGAASGSAVNVRRAGEPEVYGVRGWTVWSLGEQPSRYWDGKLLTVDPATIDTLTVTRPDATLTFEKDASGWSAAGQEVALDQAEVDALVQRLSSLRVADVVGTDPGDRFASATRVEWTTTADGANARGAFEIGAADAGNHAVRVEGSRWVVMVPTTSVSRWASLKLDELLDEPDPLDGAELP